MFSMKGVCTTPTAYFILKSDATKVIRLYANMRIYSKYNGGFIPEGKLMLTDEILKFHLHVKFICSKCCLTTYICQIKPLEMAIFICLCKIKQLNCVNGLQ